MVREVSQSSSLSSGRGYEALAAGLGAVGEGLCAIGKAEPLTQLRVSSKAANSAQPSPTGEGNNIAVFEIGRDHRCNKESPCVFPHPRLIARLRLGLLNRFRVGGSRRLGVGSCLTTYFDPSSLPGLDGDRMKGAI
jgi:hypothetical protein